MINCSDHRKILEKIARKRTYSTNISWEDALQIAYLKIVEAILAGKFSGQTIEDFYRWSAKVAKNSIVDCIDQEKKRYCMSLDQYVSDTNVPILETLSSKSNLWEYLEKEDLALKAAQIVQNLDQYYPKRKYQELWLGKVQGKTQTQLAPEMGLTQSTISKRWKELESRLLEEMGF
ncbi:MAG: sigma-70 family RNA polymerase sigma factor [Okeania sp. SIO2C2]|uniref:sigma-70 family RNA polymerase sigma factor n=1 Tax=Okeania sp. SIO2C2 TaxID=2607787 RepID=UPI0013BB3FB3|nr:sigma-70 family RNA polymerase sigma factor [Okeania sp. SIO2C2]NEP85947.1 sigma-70 family RNA polymerase sigma factor [Okeania sp. SIO2C2]